METAAIESITGLSTWAQIVVLLSVSLLAAKAIDVVGTLLIQRSSRFGNHRYDRILIEELHTPVYVTVLLAGVYASAQLVPQFGRPVQVKCDSASSGDILLKASS